MKKNKPELKGLAEFQIAFDKQLTAIKEAAKPVQEISYYDAYGQLIWDTDVMAGGQEVIKGRMQIFVEWLRNGAAAIRAKLASVLGGAKGMAQAGFDKARGAVNTGVGAAKGMAQTGFDKARGAVNTGVGAAKGMAQTGLDKARGAAAAGMAAVKAVPGKVGAGVVTAGAETEAFLAKASSYVGSKISAAGGSFMAFIKKIIVSVKGAGNGLFAKVVDSISKGLAWAKSALTNSAVWQWLRALPAKKLAGVKVGIWMVWALMAAGIVIAVNAVLNLFGVGAGANESVVLFNKADVKMVREDVDASETAGNVIAKGAEAAAEALEKIENMASTVASAAGDMSDAAREKAAGVLRTAADEIEPKQGILDRAKDMALLLIAKVVLFCGMVLASVLWLWDKVKSGVSAVVDKVTGEDEAPEASV